MPCATRSASRRSRVDERVPLRSRDKASGALLHWRSAPVGGERSGMVSRRSRVVPAVPSSGFSGFRFPPEIIVLAVWYLRFGLSYRDVEELLSERGIEVDHVTVFR